MASESVLSGTRVISVAALAAAASSAAQKSSLAAGHPPTQLTSELLQAIRGVCGKSTTTSWVVAAGVNAAVLGYVSYKLYRSAVVQQEKHKQLKRSAQRLWKLATQGGEAAGLVPEDLGEPDAAGVYSQHTATGTLFFRQVQQHPFAPPHWEWSIDRKLWIPTSYADSLWYSSEATPSTADKVLIRRLEVEGQLLARQQGGGSGSSSSSSAAAAAGVLLPPLDVSQSSRDVSSIMEVPTAFLCPISMRLMTQPVVTPSGATFDRPALLDWIRQTHTDPLSGQPLSSDQLVPNLVLRDMIHAWLQEDPAAPAAAANTSSSGGGGSSSASASASSIRRGDSSSASGSGSGGQALRLSDGASAAAVAGVDASSINTNSSSSGSGAVGGEAVCSSDSPVKGGRAALLSRDGSGVRDAALTPGTPVRASRDV